MGEISVLRKEPYGYPVRIYTAGICYHKEKFLLLRIDDSYPICPGDWEWLTCGVSFENMRNPEVKLWQNALSSLKLHTGLEGNIVQTYASLVWSDDEFYLTYVLYPVLIETHDHSIDLRQKKFSEYKWVAWEDILSFDRNNYLSSYFVHLGNSFTVQHY